MKENILEVKELNIAFTSYSKGLQQQTTAAIHNLQVHICAGEIVAVAGTSGSGKSLLAHALLGILPSNATVNGSMFYRGKEMTPQFIQRIRGKKVAFIPQSVSCLNPLMKVGKFAGKKACQLFSRYGLSKEVEELLYPHELSGGMARRVLIACAASTDADLIIADEPTAGLNDALAHETMKHLRELADAGKAVLFITHDLYLAAQYVDSVTILHEGETVETLSIDELKKGRWTNSFTGHLWNSLPENEFLGDLKERKTS